MPTQLPPNYALLNGSVNKNIAVSLKIAGLNDLITNREIFTRIVYGDPITYGEAGLVYGGLREWTGLSGGTFRDYLDWQKSSLTISQKLEPEQGRSSTSTINLSFIDYQSYMTQLCAPGIKIPDILGADCDLFLGYQELSYPQDYFIVFHGPITSFASQAGSVTLQMSDPSVKTQQQVFQTETSVLTAGISPTDTTIPLQDADVFAAAIQGPDGSYDTAITLYVLIDQELIQYTVSGAPTGADTTNFFNVVRGARGTTPDSHSAGSSVSQTFQIQDLAMNLARKLMLSGWDGNWITGIAIFNLVQNPIFTDPNNPHTIYFPNGVDVNRDYGITPGDWIILSGCTISGNNQTVQVLQLVAVGQNENQAVVTTGTFTIETNSPGTAAFRSQFDTYPVLFGMALTPKDVDVAQFTYLQNTFLGTGADVYRFYLTSSEDCKTFLESEIYLPAGAYSLTRQGRLSVGYTAPPIANQTLLYVDADSVIEPDQIRITRAVNNRKFFNVIQYSYDVADDGSTFQTVVASVDTDSLNIIGIPSTLPIASRGLRTNLGAGTVVGQRSEFLLSRYKIGALQVDLSVNWGTACQIEAGDVIGLRDQGRLQISNPGTGVRDLGVQLWEVVNRDLDIKMGRGALTLISGLQTSLTDRFATFAPTTQIIAGSTTTLINIEDSFGALYPGQEWRKWNQYVGMGVIVHSPDYTTRNAGTTLQAINPANPYQFLLSPALPFTPQPGDWLEIENYPTSADPTVDQVYKTVHCFFDPTVAVATGTNHFTFTVGGGDISKFFVNCVIRVHNTNFTQDSGDVTVLTIVGTTITVGTDMTFTPSSSDVVDLIGFADHQGAYRFV